MLKITAKSVVQGQATSEAVRIMSASYTLYPSFNKRR